MASPPSISLKSLLFAALDALLEELAFVRIEAGFGTLGIAFGLFPLRTTVSLFQQLQRNAKEIRRGMNPEKCASPDAECVADFPRSFRFLAWLDLF